MRSSHAKITFRLLLVSFLAFLLLGCSDQGTPGHDAASISLSVVDSELPADGASSTAVRAVVTDSEGFAVEKRTSVTFKTNLGSFANGEKKYTVGTVDDSGIAIVQLIAGSSTGAAEVWAEAKGVRQKVEVRFFDPHKVGTITLRTGSDSIQADGSSQVAVIATVLDSNGNPEGGVTVSFKTTLGQFFEENPIDPGILNRNMTAVTDVDGEAAVMLISGTSIGIADITASTNGLFASASVTCTAGDPATLTLRAAPSTVRPNGSTTVYAQLLDINDNPIQGQTIVFTNLIISSGGGLGSLTAVTNINGVAEVPFTCGKDAGSDVVQGCLEKDAGMKATTTIVVEPGAIVMGSITVTSGSPSIVADGVSQVKIRATVKDIDGNAAGGKTVTFKTTAGVLKQTSAVASDIGLAEVMLLSSTFAGPATVTAECDGFLADVTVQFIPGPADHIVMYALPNVVPPNGQFNIAAIVMDYYNNRLDDQRLTFLVRQAYGNGEVLDSKEMTPDQADDGVYRSTLSAAYGNFDLEIMARVSNGVNKKVIVTVDEDAIIVGSIKVIAGTDKMEADGVSTTTIRATVLDHNNQPAPGITVKFSTTLGSLSAGQKATDQNGFAEVTLRSGTTWGTATVTADANGFKARVDVLLTSGQAGGLNVEAVPGTVLPGGQSTIIAELNNGSGQPVEGEMLYFDLYDNNTNSSLSVVKQVTDVNGRATVNYIAGVTEGTDRIRVRSASNSSIVDTTSVSVRIPTGIVGYMTLTSGASSIKVNTGSTSITAKIYDTTGNPMPEGTGVTFKTTLGTFPGGTDPDGAGELTSQRTLYTADNSGVLITSLMAGPDAGVAKVTAVSGSVSQVLNIIIDDGSVVVGSITLSATKTSIPADGASSTAITATVRDTGGSPVPNGTPVVFTTIGTGDPLKGGTFAFGTDLSSVTVYTTGNTGTATTSLIAADNPDVARVTAAAGSKSQLILITFTGDSSSAEVGVISLTTTNDTIIADGKSSTAITAKVTDTKGDPMPQGTVVEFTTNKGTFVSGSPPQTITKTIVGSDGSVTVSLISDTTPGTALVSAQAGDVTQSINIFFVKVGSITLIANPTSIPKEEGTSSAITATVLDTTGKAAPKGTLVSFTTNLGVFPGSVTTINLTTADHTGKITTSLIVEAATPAGNAKITASSGGVNQIIFVNIYDNTSGGGTINSLELTAANDEIVADGSSQVLLRALVKDLDNKPLSGVTVNFSYSFGTLSVLTDDTDSNGNAETMLRSATRAGVAQVIASAGGFSDVVLVDFVPGPPVNAKSSVTVQPANIPADGTSQAIATVTLADAFGNPVLNGTDALLYAYGTGATPTNPSIQAPNPTKTSSGRATFTIIASSVQGTAYLRLWDFPAINEAQIFFGSIGSGNPSSILVQSVSKTEIFVTGVGKQDNSTITIRLVDEIGNSVADPIYDNLRISFLAKPNGGEFLSGENFSGTLVSGDTIEIATEDGYASFNVRSGSLPGVLEIRIEAIDSGGGSLTPVVATVTPQISIASGPPHIITLSGPTLAAITDLNKGPDSGIPQTPGFYSRKAGLLVTDRYGNAVSDGTVVNLGVLDSVISDGWGTTTASNDYLTDLTADFVNDFVFRNGVFRYIQPNDRLLIYTAEAEDKSRFVAAGPTNPTEIEVTKAYANDNAFAYYTVGASLLGASIYGIEGTGATATATKGTVKTENGLADLRLVYPANASTILVGCYGPGIDTRHPPVDSARVITVFTTSDDSATLVDESVLCFSSIAGWKLEADPTAISSSATITLKLVDGGDEVPLPFILITPTVQITKTNDLVVNASPCITGLSGECTSTIDISYAFGTIPTGSAATITYRAGDSNKAQVKYTAP